MANIETKVKASELANKLTLVVKVKGMFIYGLRLKIGCLILGLAAKVMGCNIEINVNN